MNKQELIEKIKNLSYTLTWNIPHINREIVIDLIEQLDELQPLKLKDIISRMKQLFPNNRTEWIDEILKEFGEEFGSMKFKAGYEQGKFESGLAGIERAWNKPVVPQFVADWYEGNKDSFDYNLWEYLTDWEEQEPSDFKNWISDKNNAFQTLVNMHQFGYEVEKEKRYYVRFKWIEESYSYLTLIKHLNTWMLSSIKLDKKFRTEHTKKQLEEAGFGWVFDCPGIEIEEVKE